VVADWARRSIGLCPGEMAEQCVTRTVRRTARPTASPSRRRDRQWLVSSADRLSQQLSANDVGGRYNGVLDPVQRVPKNRRDWINA